MLLQEKPFEQIRIKEVAQQAGFSRHAFYSHFDSKEALLFSYVDDLFRKIADLVCDGYEGKEKVELYELLKRSFDLWRDHAEMLQYVMQVDNKDLVLARFRRHTAIIIELYLQNRRTTPPDHELEAYVLEYATGGLFELIKRWANEGMVHDSAKMAQLLLDVMPLDLLVGEEQI